MKKTIAKAPAKRPPRYTTEKQERIEKLRARLYACGDRISDLMDALHDGISKMSPYEYDCTLDKYRAELVRYKHIDSELEKLEDREKSDKYKEFHRMTNDHNRNKIRY